MYSDHNLFEQYIHSGQDRNKWVLEMYCTYIVIEIHFLVTNRMKATITRTQDSYLNSGANFCDSVVSNMEQ